MERKIAVEAWHAFTELQLLERPGVKFVTLLTDECGCILLAKGILPDYLREQAADAIKWNATMERGLAQRAIQQEVQHAMATRTPVENTPPTIRKKMRHRFGGKRSRTSQGKHPPHGSEKKTVMPFAPPHTCPKCGFIVVGKCKRCESKRDNARGSAAARGYDHEWAEYSRAWLSVHQWCGERADGRQHPEHSQCTREGLKVRATVTDHIKAMRAGGEKFDPANHQSLCGACNRRKGISIEGGFAVLR